MARHSFKPVNVIIDTDPGVDDLLAILLAINSPELQVDALTTVGGNCSLADATRNALRILEIANRPDIPVYKGAARPLKGRYVYARYFHGPRGMTGRLSEPGISAADDLNAIDAIASRIASARAPVTLIALGPLTNVARLITRRPDAVGHISPLIVMGGAVDVPGNVTPYAEFNTYSDPEAAEVVFRSGMDVKLIGLDVCNPVFLQRNQAGHMTGVRGRVVRGWFDFHPEFETMSLCDPLAVVAAMRPELFTYEEGPVGVVTQGEERGRTFRGTVGPFISFATGVDAKGAYEVIRSRVLT